MSNQDEDKLINNIKQTLDESADNLDALTLSKIRQVRASAIERTDSKPRYWLGLTGGMLASACVMVFAVMILIQSPTPDSINTTPVDDLELISSSDNLELYEDLEFYEWLEDEALFG